MLAVKIIIIEWVDDGQPGWVKGQLEDARGHTFTFVEKVPVVTKAYLDGHSLYPQPGVIACEVVRRWLDDVNRKVVTISTDRPWGVEATTGEMRFDVLADQLTELCSFCHRDLGTCPECGTPVTGRAAHAAGVPPISENKPH
jgi:hypothetical protein